MTGMATMTIQAPSANFVAMTTAVTTKVATAPTPFMSARAFQLRPRVLCQWRTMPACASVNAVKTPITYRWMSESTSARKATMSAAANPARTTIPFE